ncbi:MAG: NAD(P)-binding protein [Desulfitobacteriaceae bacterium]
MTGALKEIPPIWTTGWTDVLNTGTWRSAKPIFQNRPSPCQGACPIGSDIPSWIQLAIEEDFQHAWLTLVENNPFPAITGRVCHHPCQTKCNRAQFDGAVTINALEQFVADLALKMNWSLPRSSESKTQRVAIIGGGPAGLSCAYQLRRLGYRVTIFEAQAELGGVLRYGIPAYRLAKEVVKGEINRLLALGFDIRMHAPVSGEELTRMAREFDAVFWAVGAQRSKILPQFPRNHPRVITGLEFLSSVNQGHQAELGQEVVVIGGGSVAMDVARTARRLGRRVQVVALENKQSLPAQPDEVEQALAEGITIIDGTIIQSILEVKGQFELACAKVVSESNAASQADADFSLRTDTIIMAVGQDTVTDGLPSGMAGSNDLVSVDIGQSTASSGIFAGGDATTLDRYVSAAIGSGLRAARSINSYLADREAEETFTDSLAEITNPVSFNEINTFYFSGELGEEREMVSLSERLRDFREVRSGLTEARFKMQASRCFNCGHCIKCDNCYYFCPDMAVVKNVSKDTPYRILDQYCKGCGLCVEECPRGVTVLQEERS